MLIPDDVPVNAERDPRDSVPELRLRHWWSGAGREKQAGVSVTESVEPTARNLERVEDRHECLSHDIFRDEEFPARIEK